MVDRKEQRRLEHADLSRAQLLDAAEEVFGQKGYHETTLKEVADRAGFAVGTVYTLFDSKDDLFRQVFDRRNEEWIPAMWNVLDDDGPPRLQLHALVDLLVAFCRTHPAFARLYLRYATPNATRSQPFEETIRLQADVIARGQRKKMLRTGDPESLSRLLTGMVTAFQAQDPLILEGDVSVAERFPLTELHDMVEHAFMLPVQ